jgi:peptide/nickel transport system substrate-binding protein
MSKKFLLVSALALLALAISAGCAAQPTPEKVVETVVVEKEVEVVVTEIVEVEKEVEVVVTQIVEVEKEVEVIVTVEVEVPAEEPADEPVVVKFAIVDPGGEANSMDPLNQPSGENSLMVNMAYNRLVDMDSDFQIIPELAESYEYNEDATEWTFHLRKGVKFHDGKEMVADDVVYTFQRILDPAKAGDDTAPGSEGAPMLAFMDYDGIIAEDDYTVKFILPEPVVELPLLISIKAPWIVQKGATHDELHTSGMGTGPFIPVDFEPQGSPHEFVKFEGYWEEGLPLADQVDLYMIIEATTRAAAIQAGEVDFVQIVDFANVPELEADPDVNLVASKASISMLGVMWVDTPPYDDPNVRKALKMVYDKQAVVDICWLGYGVIGDDNPIEPTSPNAWRPLDEVPTDADIEGAMALLAESGYGPDNPLEVEFYASEQFPGFLCFAQMLKAGAEEAGIKFDLVTAPVEEYWDNVWLKVPFMLSAHNQRPPSSGLTISHHSESKYPETHWYYPEYDELLLQAGQEADPDKRLALYQEAMQWITEEGGDVFEGKFFTVAAERSNCTGYMPHSQIARFDARRLYCER